MEGQNPIRFLRDLTSMKCLERDHFNRENLCVSAIHFICMIFPPAHRLLFMDRTGFYVIFMCA